jgi:hypothetical protein
VTRGGGNEVKVAGTVSRQHTDEEEEARRRAVVEEARQRGGGRPQGVDGTGVEQFDGGQLDARQTQGLERRGVAELSESAPSLKTTTSEAMGAMELSESELASLRVDDVAGFEVA